MPGRWESLSARKFRPSGSRAGWDGRAPLRVLGRDDSSAALNPKFATGLASVAVRTSGSWHSSLFVVRRDVVLALDGVLEHRDASAAAAADAGAHVRAVAAAADDRSRRRLRDEDEVVLGVGGHRMRVGGLRD